MQIGEKLIEYLEELSYLSLTDEEKLRLTDDLQEILSDMTRLGELSAEGVPECAHPFDNVNSFRDDRVKDSFDRKLILQNAPDKNNEVFIAPMTIE